jgi:hypothetical protein|tara:strand:+ start:431 stop:904 length:474 start_codon:yes stop_codon:yes gene_type:complete
MNSNTFNEALKATARIACCAGLVGLVACQTKVDDSVSDSNTTPTDTQSEDNFADTGDTASQPEDQIIVPEEPTFDVCMEVIEAGFADPEFDTSELLDCCILTTEEVGFESLYNDPQYADLNENCCEEIMNQGEWSSACTPWGPPTPPSMCSKGAAHA